MPPLPELRHGGAAVGGVKVHRQADTEEPGHACGDVAVAGEVKVQLEGVAQDHQPGRRGAQLPQMGPAVVHHGAEGVRQQHLLDGAAADGVAPRRRVGPVRPEEVLSPQLGEEGVRPQDRAGGDNGKKQAVEQQRVPRSWSVFPGVGLLQQPQLLEGEEAQAQRRPAHLHRAAGEESRVLEAHQHSDVVDTGQGQRPAAVCACPAQPPEGPGRHGNAQQQADKSAQHHGPATGPQEVKDGGGNGQQGCAPSGAPPPHRQADRQRHRQERQKAQGLEAHLLFSVRALRRASAVLSTWVRLWHRPG